MHGRARVLSLPPVGGGRRAARLLDDDRSCAHAGSFGGAARRVGAPARDGCFLRRSANLRLSPLDHVLPQILLFLRTAEEELARTLCVPWPQVEGAADPARRSSLEE